MHSVGVFRAASRLARLCPEQVKRIRFRRTNFGRRGLAEEQVYGFLRAVVDELTARDGVEAGLRAENARLKIALRGRFTLLSVGCVEGEALLAGGGFASGEAA
ncbi:DivIVA domain-containing protein, partial [Micromonospora sp. NPDC005174]|uniref:DivIVA domain-containing protein n=1 Tax=Micromonospora sp. NPDC005174 TaxID=3157018 RepID=UPI0033A661D6